MISVYQAGESCIYGGNTLKGPARDAWCFNSTFLSWTQKTLTGVIPTQRYMNSFTDFWYQGTHYLAIYGGYKKSSISSGIHL